jgi:hypothetical protein
VTQPLLTTLFVDHEGVLRTLDGKSRAVYYPSTDAGLGSIMQVGPQAVALLIKAEWTPASHAGNEPHCMYCGGLKRDGRHYICSLDAILNRAGYTTQILREEARKALK